MPFTICEQYVRGEQCTRLEAVQYIEGQVLLGGARGSIGESFLCVFDIISSILSNPPPSI